MLTTDKLDLHIMYLLSPFYSCIFSVHTFSPGFCLFYLFPIPVVSLCVFFLVISAHFSVLGELILRSKLAGNAGMQKCYGQVHWFSGLS